MSDVRFYLDEPIARSVHDALRRRGIDVTGTDEAGMKGTSDEEQLHHATQQRRVVVLGNDDSPLHARGAQHSGIAFIPSQASIGAIVQGLILVYQVLGADEMRNHVEFL